jgi:hypothetical protein
MELVMANDPALANSSASVNSGSASGGAPSPAAALFQKAHAKMVTLQRLDEQLAAMFEQRKKLQDELRCVQLMINEEFERIMHAAREGEARFMSQYADVAAGGNGRPSSSRRNGAAAANQPLHLEVAEAV